MSPSVSIIIVNYNGRDYIGATIESALRQRYDGPFDVIVVDNHSTDESVAFLHSVASIRIIESATNGGFAAGANRAAFDTEADYLAFLNPDAIADPNWIADVVAWMNQGHVDLASSVVRAGDRIWFAGGTFVEALGTPLVRFELVDRTDWVSGCALIVRRMVFAGLGGFDDGFFLYSEDVDLSLRARRDGHTLAVFPSALVDHPQDGRSTRALGLRRASIFYASRGRLIARHVPIWWLPFALGFTCFVSPLQNGVSAVRLPSIARSVIEGFRVGKTSIAAGPKSRVPARPREEVE